MKKLWLIGIVMILAMTALSCDNAWGPITDTDSGSESAAVPESFQANVTASGKFTADGRPMLDLSIPTGGGSSRALTDALAKAATDYYEVIFFDGTNYFRTAGYKGETLRLSVPASDYTGSDKAIILAGTRRDMTLLAAGIISKVDAANTAPFNIGVNTREVTFTLTSLTTNVNASATSTFGITQAGILTSAGNFGITQDKNGNRYPFFKINETSTNSAVFNIGGLGAPDALGNGIMIQTINPPITSVGLNGFGGDPVVITGNVANATANTAIGATGLVLSLNTAGITSGVTRITIDVPVIGLSALAAGGSGGFVWHVRGGLDNNDLELGPPKTGGSIVLTVGNPAGFQIVPPSTPLP